MFKRIRENENSFLHENKIVTNRMIKKLKKSPYEKDKANLALHLESASKSVNEKPNNRSEKIHLPLYAPFIDQKKHGEAWIGRLPCTVLTVVFNFCSKPKILTSHG